MGEWCVAVDKRRRGHGRQDESQRELAREVLLSMFAPPPRRQQQQSEREEWRCTCGRTNWSDRKVCRICGAPRPPRPPAAVDV